MLQLKTLENLDSFTGFLKASGIDLRKAVLVQHFSLYVFLVLTKNCDLPSGESRGVLVTLWTPQKCTQFFSFYFCCCCCCCCCWKNKVGSIWIFDDSMKNNQQKNHSVYIQSNFFLSCRQRSLDLESRDLHWREIPISRVREFNVSQLSTF